MNLRDDRHAEADGFARCREVRGGVPTSLHGRRRRFGRNRQRQEARPDVIRDAQRDERADDKKGAEVYESQSGRLAGHLSNDENFNAERIHLLVNF